MTLIRITSSSARLRPRLWSTPPYPPLQCLLPRSLSRCDNIPAFRRLRHKDVWIWVRVALQVLPLQEGTAGAAAAAAAGRARGVR